MEDIESVVLFLIDQTSKTAKRLTQKEFDKRKLGITVDQWVLLKVIDEREPMSQQELSEFTRRDGASIARTMDLLERKDFVKRTPLPANRRQYHIALTNFGKSFVKEHMDLIQYFRKKSLEGFSKEEIQALQDMLMRIQENML